MRSLHKSSAIVAGLIIAWAPALARGIAAEPVESVRVWQRWEKSFEAMDLPGSRQLGHLADLFTSLPWWKLRPDPDFARRAGGRTSGPALTHVVYTRDRKGSAVLYLDGMESGVVRSPYGQAEAGPGESCRHVPIARRRGLGAGVSLRQVTLRLRCPGFNPRTRTKEHNRPLLRPPGPSHASLAQGG